jgi:glycolate oxidase FAD binding subunit
MSELADFAEQVGSADPVTIAGLSTRGGAVPHIRCVAAPRGVYEFQADEMTVRCGAGTPVQELVDALAEAGQTVALPVHGTVGGALAVGHSSLRRLGDGPVRDVLLQARYVGSAGQLVTAGGPTVKNVSGFDLCRLLVGSRGSLGFLGEVVLRTRPRPTASQWFHCETTDPTRLLLALYRPTSILWNGSSAWALLEGHPSDITAQATAVGLTAVDGPPALPTGSRRSVAPSAVLRQVGQFVAEVGVGIVHHAEPDSARNVDPEVARIASALKRELDPAGRLNPGVVA